MPSDEARELARRLVPGTPANRFRAERLEALSFEDGVFDTVLCSAVLHFADGQPHFDGMLGELWRVLAPGGLLFTRLASSIGLEDQVRPIGSGRYRLPDGTDRFLVNEAMLLAATDRLGGRLADPIKTTNVQGAAMHDHLVCVERPTLRAGISPGKLRTMDTAAIASSKVASGRHRLAVMIGTLVVVTAATSHTQSNTDMNDLAERYVKLVLAMGQHDSDYVDAYYGPQAWRADAEARPLTLEQIGATAETLITALDRHGDRREPGRTGPTAAPVSAAAARRATRTRADAGRAGARVRR